MTLDALLDHKPTAVKNPTKRKHRELLEDPTDNSERGTTNSNLPNGTSIGPQMSEN